MRSNLGRARTDLGNIKSNLTRPRTDLNNNKQILTDLALVTVQNYHYNKRKKEFGRIGGSETCNMDILIMCAENI